MKNRPTKKTLNIFISKISKLLSKNSKDKKTNVINESIKCTPTERYYNGVLHDVRQVALNESVFISDNTNSKNEKNINDKLKNVQFLLFNDEIIDSNITNDKQKIDATTIGTLKKGSLKNKSINSFNNLHKSKLYEHISKLRFSTKNGKIKKNKAKLNKSKIKQNKTDIKNNVNRNENNPENYTVKFENKNNNLKNNITNLSTNNESIYTNKSINKTYSHKNYKSSQVSHNETDVQKNNLPNPKINKRINKLESKINKYNKKRDKAKAKLPVKEIVVKERIYNESKNKSSVKLNFQNEIVPINEAKWNQPIKRPLIVKAISSATAIGINRLHFKIYEVESENVGTQAAHRAELIGESMFRGSKKIVKSIYRHVKNSPYRNAAKYEAKSIKTQVKLDYHVAVKNNPNIKSNPISRYFQKRQIKRKYAAELRKAKKSGQTIKATGNFITKITQTVNNVIRKNPITMLHMGIILLIILSLISLFTMCSSILSGVTSITGVVSYAAADTDINNAELAYTEWEVDLQLKISKIYSNYSGYDEYKINIDDIGHDPFELMAFLTAVYGDFSYSQIEPILYDLFIKHYHFIVSQVTETRTRTETRVGIIIEIDGSTTPYFYTVEVEYNWHILYVKLESASFTSIITPLMDANQQFHFEALMRTKGARQYVGNPFDFNWLPYVNNNFGYRIQSNNNVIDCHMGIDIAVPAGTVIKCGFDGTAAHVGFDAAEYGNYIVIKNNKGLQAKYTHCQSIEVTERQNVMKDDIIAISGNSDISSVPHVHIEIIKNGQYLNPIYFMETGDDGSGRMLPGMPGGIVIPPYSGEPMGDGSFAALLAEAERYIGYPYVWGGSSPSSSFDCSGYICWILNQSGVADVGRTTAQGLFNLCTPIGKENAEPGDLIFFTKTYSSSQPVTHVALYIGGDTFLHAGNPIGYGNWNTNYWINHFYAVGRIN